MRNVLTIVKKELDRVFTDKRLVLTVFILPMISIVLIYGLMGVALENEISEVKEFKSNVYIQNSPSEFKDLLNEMDLNMNIYYDDEESIDNIKSKILNGEVQLLVVFEDNFTTLINDYENTESIPQVNTFYNYSENKSDKAYGTMLSALHLYRDELLKDRMDSPEDATAFEIDKTNEGHNIVDEEKATGKGLSMLLPMLIVIFLFSGAMGIGPDSIAGEKERGTIATMLLTPIKRSQLAIGKVISISIISIFGAISSFIGILLSMKFASRILTGGQNVSISDIKYTSTHYFMLFLVIITTIATIVGLVCLVSVFAKNVKEASMYIMPFYILAIASTMINSFSEDIPTNITQYLIPLLNTSTVIKGILMFEIEWWQVLVTSASSIVYGAILIFFIQKMFKSEKVMFR